MSLPQLMSLDSVTPSSHLILCHPLLLLPSIFASIRVFSSESALHIRWPKYWNSSLSIPLWNVYSNLLLIFFKLDRLIFFTINFLIFYITMHILCLRPLVDVGLHAHSVGGLAVSLDELSFLILNIVNLSFLPLLG